MQEANFFSISHERQISGSAMEGFFGRKTQFSFLNNFVKLCCQRGLNYFLMGIVLCGAAIGENIYAADLPQPHSKCVQIYYDKLPHDATYTEGRVDVIFLQNLLGHFANIQQYILPVRSYKKGDLEKCDASIYIGSNYNDAENIPDAFYKDFLATKRNVLWMKYGIWRYSAADLEKLWGVRYRELEDIDTKHPDAKGRPGYFNQFSYKGEEFSAYGEFDQDDPKNFLYSSDLVVLDVNRKQSDTSVLSWATHSTRNEKVPYILRNKNHWYMADTPFAYVDFGDRYFILADLLFDVLDEPPVNGGKKYALVRFEDVSVIITPSIKQMVDMFVKEKISFALSVIPIYNDPLKIYNFRHYIEMNQSSDFLKMLRYAQDKGGSFIMHGVTHQYDSKKNPFSGVSGEDFEFWDKPNEAPIKEDSVAYVVNRLAKGVAMLQEAHLPFQAWMTPHYLASSLDNTIFGQVFTWNVGQVNYALNKTSNLKILPDKLTFNLGGTNDKINAERLTALMPLKVTNIPHADRNDQLHPYELYGDYYGQRIIPEDLGNVQPFLSNQVIHLRDVDEILRDAKRLSVLRDVWASFFIHAILLNTKDRNGLAKFPGDTSELERLISGVKALGYEFIDLKSWAPTHIGPRRPDPIEPDPFPVD